MTEVQHSGSRARQMAAIFLVSLAGLLLEVGYTRIVGFKLWYYYTYLVIGLALLGIGSGGIVVVLWKRLRETSTEQIIAVCSIFGAISIVIGYLVIANITVNTLVIWDYGTRDSAKNFAILGLICFTIFASFIALGIIVATILGRAPEGGIGRLYFADLIGAGLGCLAAIPLITWLGPPQVIMLSALLFAIVGLLALLRRPGVLMGIGVGMTILLGLILTSVIPLADVKTEIAKQGPEAASYSDWGPVFRVDVLFVADDTALLLHDGTFGSAMHEYDGNAAGLTRYDTDPRSLPFAVLGDPPGRQLIIGSAAGNEILASLHFKAKKIEAVELNPVTISLLNDHYKDFTGDLPNQPGVELHQGDGRIYLARSEGKYDLIWFVAPDSYAANNAASSGAFVLSESYLYTKEMIADSLERLTDDGIIVAQFGDRLSEKDPDRTARYVSTARAAMKDIGIKKPGDHIILSSFVKQDSDLSTIILKRTPFTAAEVERYSDAAQELPLVNTPWTPGQDPGDYLPARLAAATDAEAAAILDGHDRAVGAISDDAPFFWHFAEFDDVLANIFEPLKFDDPEDAVGERVLLLLLAVAIVYSAVFLLAPFLFVRKEWRALPAKGTSALYFSALGLGFMFYEITMIQRLVRFLGYPTYSLTVTLASILVFTGLGALISKRFADRRWLMPVLLGVLAAITLFYEFGLDDLTESLLGEGLAVRVIVALAVLAPLGLCLGMFMPLGLSLAAKLSVHGDEYIAWSWAINGFFSVIGSVLTTILSMSFGFSAVQFLALGVYAVAALTYTRLASIARRTTVDPEPPPPPETTPTPAVAAP